MIATQNDQMTDSQVKEHLRDVTPWYAVDANVAMLRGARIQDIDSKIARLEGSLVISPDYTTAWREHLSIFMDADDNTATRKAFFEKKKSADEAIDLKNLREQLRGFHIVTNLGVRLDINTLPLPQLRKHAATIAENRRLQAMSAEEIRTDNKVKNPVKPRRLDGMPWLPESLVLPAGLRLGDQVTDGFRAVDITPTVINRLARSASDSPEFHYYRFRLVRAYGAQQVTERSQG